MPKALLSIPHQRQQNEADCLAACAAMVLAHLGEDMDYSQLLQLLDVRACGAPASNIRRLKEVGLSVVYSVTNMAGLEAALDDGDPIIVFVRTGDLPYWQYPTDHALVVVGYDDENIYVNDPAFAEVPITISRGDFELAWLERDYHYARVTAN